MSIKNNDKALEAVSAAIIVEKLEIINFKSNPLDLIEDNVDMSIHIRMQKRNGKKCITIISGLEHPRDVMEKMRKKFSCGGAIVNGNVIQLQGDLRKQAQAHLIATGTSSGNIFMHGY